MTNAQEIIVNIDAVTKERIEQHYCHGDYATISRAINKPHDKNLVKNAITQGKGPFRVVLAIKEYYEEKDRLNTELLTPKI